MVAVPISLTVDDRAVQRLPTIIEAVGLGGTTLLVASGPGPSRELGDRVHGHLGQPADRYLVQGNGRDDVIALDVHCARNGVEGLIAVGGGRVIDVCKAVARQRDLPVLVAPTALSSDGIASPVAVIRELERSVSLPARMPIGVLIDLEMVRGCPRRVVLSGLGDLLANLSASLDWQLAIRAGTDTWDGFADILARQAAEQVLFLEPEVLFERDGLVRLAEGLVMSGIAMAIAGSSRPCSGAEHLISHALDGLGFGCGTHGEQVALGVLYLQALRTRFELPCVAPEALELIRASGLPCSPAAISVSRDAFLTAIRHAPATRPGRYTILSEDHDTEILKEAFDQAFQSG